MIDDLDKLKAGSIIATSSEGDDEKKISSYYKILSINAPFIRVKFLGHDINNLKSDGFENDISALIIEEKFSLVTR